MLYTTYTGLLCCNYFGCGALWAEVLCGDMGKYWVWMVGVCMQREKEK